MNIGEIFGILNIAHFVGENLKRKGVKLPNKKVDQFSGFFRLDELEIFKEKEMEENEFTCIFCGMLYDESERKEAPDGENICETCYVHYGFIECPKCGQICDPGDSAFCMQCGGKLK